METKQIVESRLGLLMALYDMHTKYFMNVIDGISEQDTHNRLNTKANHIAWIAGSIVHERYDLAYILGVSRDEVNENEKLQGLFSDHQGIQDKAEYPSLATYRAAWERISPVLKERLQNLNDEQLQQPDPYDMPGQDITLADSIAFLIDRESYCIGQIGLYRRLLGYEAMKY